MTVGHFAWSLRYGDDLLCRQWGQDLLVWHRRSGDTHLLTGLAAKAFLRLQEGSACTAEIQHGIGAPPDGRAPPASDLEATLRDLMRLGLVTAQPT